MYPEIDLGPVTLQTFGLMFALAFLAAGAVVAKRLEEIGKPPDWAYEITFSALAGGIIGSRLYYLVENYDKVKDDLLGNLFSGSGLVWYGGAIGGAIAVVIWAWYRGFLGLALLDLTAVPLALGYAIGRCGCQLSGDGDYGKAWDGPWAMSYPDGTVPTTQTVHPTPVYETLAMGWERSCSGSFATASGPGSCSRSTSSTPAPSGSWSSSCAATRTRSSGSPNHSSRAL